MFDCSYLVLRQSILRLKVRELGLFSYIVSRMDARNMLSTSYWLGDPRCFFRLLAVTGSGMCKQDFQCKFQCPALTNIIYVRVL